MRKELRPMSDHPKPFFKKNLNDIEALTELFFKSIFKVLRLLFILIMMVYLLDCLIDLAEKIILLTLHHGILDFGKMKIILTDALFTLIVLSTIKTLFIRSNYVYAVTFLEIGFVALMRKVILLEVDPADTWLMLVLGLLSAVFFGLILYANTQKEHVSTE